MKQCSGSGGTNWLPGTGSDIPNCGSGSESGSLVFYQRQEEISDKNQLLISKKMYYYDLFFTTNFFQWPQIAR